MQINHFTNNTHFSPPLAKGGALGATRLASPANTQRVGENGNIAKETANSLLDFVSYQVRRNNLGPDRRNNLGPDIGALSTLFLEEVASRRIRLTIATGIIFQLENFILGKFLEKLEPKSQQGFVETLGMMRGYIAQGLFKAQRDPYQYTDGTIVYLKELLRAQSTPASRPEVG
jgi:hypothetical protein